MKPNTFLRSLLSITGSAALTAPLANAATLYWDANGATTAQTDGAGAWDTALGLKWWDGSTNVDWTSGDDAVFGNGGAGGAVTLANPTTIGSLTFNYFTGTYTLGTAGQAITLNSGITKNSVMGHTQNGGVSSVVNIISPVILGADQTWLNNSTNLQSTAANGSLKTSSTIDNGGFNLTIAGTGTTQITGILSGSGGLVKNGNGTLLLREATHTYTGDTIINGGVVRIAGTDSFGAGTSLTINEGVIEGYFGGAFTRSLGTAAGQIQILGGNSGFSGQGGTGTSFTIGASGSTLQWGSPFFNPDVFVLQSAAVNTNGKMTLNNAIDLNGATRTITSLGADASGGATVTGAITDSLASGAGLNKTGFGNLILQGNNTYTGATNVTGGSWVVPNSTAVAQGGWLTLSGANGALSATSEINLNGATLQMINTTAQTAVDRVNNAANFTVSNGGGITWNNASGNNIAYAETLGSVSVSSGQFNLVLTTNQAGTGTSAQTLTLGGLSRSGSSVLTFSAGGTGPQAAGNKNMIVVTGSGTTTGWVNGDSSNSIIGAYATTGTAANAQTDYAVYNGDYVVAANTADSAETTWTDSTKAYTTGVGGTVTLTGTRTITALRNTGATTLLTLASGADLRTTGILNGAATVLTINPGTGGTLSSASGGDLYLTAGTGGITINAAVTNDGGTTNLVKSGSGLVILTAADNTFGGNITVNAGILQFGIGNPNTSVQLSGGDYAGNIFIAAGAALSFSGRGTNSLSGIISGDGNLNLNRGTTTLSGANTYTGKTSMTLLATNATGSTINISSFNSVVGGTASSSLGAPTTVANGTIDFGGGGIQQTAQINYTGSGETTDRVINFQFNGGGARVIDSSGGANALLKFTSAAVSNATNGNITLQGSTNGEFVQGLGFSFNNLTKSGAGTWTLGGAVGLTGTTTISGGTLKIGGAGSLRGGNYAGNISIASTSSGNLEMNTTANQTLSGVISGAGALNQTGSGTTTLTNTNTYSGATKISAGTLAVNGTGSINNSSAVTVAAGGRLTYNSSTALTTTVDLQGSDISNRAVLGGSGTIGVAVTLDSVGDVLSPGNSPGAQTYTVGQIWSSFSYDWELNNWADQVAGTNIDQVAISGTLDLTGNAINNYYLNILSLDGSNAANPLSNFTESSNSWTILTTTGGITGFNASYWNLNAAGFQNTETGTWSLAQSGSDLVLSYTVIPEPSLALLGALGLLTMLRRRRA